MISVKEAEKIVFSHPFKPDHEIIPLQESVDRYLDETVYADRDFPPFHRVTMDGIAVSFQSYADGRRDFVIEDIQPAGVPRKRLSDSTNCMEVMTGAAVPDGADLVIRYEDLEINDGKALVLSGDYVKNQNIHARGIDVLAGTGLAFPGTFLSPAEIALLASVGKSVVRVKRFPRTAIVSTGDELVEVTATPDDYQVRRSNSYALYGALREVGVLAHMFHAPDEESRLGIDLWNIVAEHDLIVLTGGVSKGKFDFVPGILEKMDVNRHFHGVSQRPGKPFWFGTAPEGKTVFALPGNPVSTYMCFYRYILPWLRRSMGDMSTPRSAILSEDFEFMPQLTYFLQVSVKTEQGRLMAVPLAGHGSGDFANLGNVDGFMELPPERSVFKAGEAFPYIAFRLLK